MNDAPAPALLPWKPVFVSLLCAGGLLAVLLPWIPIRVSLAKFAIEDTFYYLKASENIVAGLGSSMDGINPTNGYHPMWMVLCCLLQVVASSSRDLVPHLSFALCSALFLGTAFLIHRCVKTCSSGATALLATVFLVCNYRFVTVALCGLETAVYGFFLLLFISRAVRREGIDNLSDAIAIGCLLGLVCLSRMDAFLLCGVFYTWSLFRPAPQHFLRRFGLVTLAGVSSLAILAPWFVFSWKNSGALLPNSRAAFKVWGARSAGPIDSVSSLLAYSKERIGKSIEPANDLANLLGVWPFAPPGVGSLRYGGVAAMALAFVGLLVFLWKMRGSDTMRRLGWIPLYLFAHGGYYFFQHRISIRYLYPALLALLVFSAIGFGDRLRKTRDPQRLLKKLSTACLLLVFLSAVGSAQAFWKGFAANRFHSYHVGLYEGLATRLRENSPKDAVVGCWNSGIVSYYSERKVVNLDGVMNDNAIEALRDRRLAAYLDEQGISFLADIDGQIEKFMDGYGGDPDWRDKWRVRFKTYEPHVDGLGAVFFVVMEKVP